MAETGEIKLRRKRTRRAVLLMVTLLVAYFVIRLAIFVTGKPVISVDYTAEYNRLMEPAGYSPDDDAFPCYREAFARLPAISPHIPAASRLHEYSPSSIEWRMVEAWLATSNEARDLLAQAAEKPCCWLQFPAINSHDPPAMSDVFGEFRRAALCLRYQVEYLIAKDDVAAASGCILTIFRMARHVGNQARFQILVSSAIRGLAQSAVFDLLSRTNLDAESLSRLQTQFEEVLSCEEAPSFRGDQVLLCDALQHYFTDNGRDDGHLIPKVIHERHRQEKPPAHELADNAAYLKNVYIAWTQPTRRRTRQAVEDFIPAASQLFRQTPWELHRQGTSYEEQMHRLTEDNYFLRCTIDDTRIFDVHARAQVSGAALITTLGLLRFHQEKGVWPQSLEELAAGGYIRQVPIDPYSGRPLAYRQENGSFTLYSFGLDFDDDNGTRSVWGDPSRGGGDQVFWPVEEQGQ